MRYSLVQKIASEKLDSKGTANVTVAHYTIHSQVKRQVLGRMSPQLLNQSVSWVIQNLRRHFPRHSVYAAEFDDKDPKCQALIAHILALRTIISQQSIDVENIEDLASLYLDGGIFKWSQGRLELGRELTTSAKELFEIGRVSLFTGSQIYSFGASILSDAGQFDQGLRDFVQALVFSMKYRHELKDSEDEDSLKRADALIANAYHNLAAAHNNFDSIESLRDAAQYNEKALKLKLDLEKRGLPVSHLLCLSYQSMAHTESRLGNLETAAQCFQKALDYGSRSKESAPRRALTLHNFAHLKLQENKLREARELFEDAWGLRAETLDAHPQTATSQHMVAHCWQKLGGEKNLLLSRSDLVKSLRLALLAFLSAVACAAV